MSDVQDRNEHGMTKRTYVEAVLDGIRQYHEAASTSSGATPCLWATLRSSSANVIHRHAEHIARLHDHETLTQPTFLICLLQVSKSDFPITPNQGKLT